MLRDPTTPPSLDRPAEDDAETEALRKAFSTYLVEVRGPQREQKLTTLIEQLRPLGITNDWCSLHRLAISERARLTARVRRLPEVAAAWKEAHAAAVEFNRQHPHRNPDTPEEAAEWEAPGAKEQLLFSERATLITEEGWLRGLEAGFPALFDLPLDGPTSLGLPPAVANKLREILGNRADDCGGRYDLPPPPPEEE